MATYHQTLSAYLALSASTGLEFDFLALHIGLPRVALIRYGAISGDISERKRWTVSEGVGEARPEAEGELALARIALDDGDPRHAATHAGNAIAGDPTLREAYEALDELAARADDALGLFPVAGTPYIGAVAARSYVLACSPGAVNEAFALLCEVAKTEPGKPFSHCCQRSRGGSARMTRPLPAARDPPRGTRAGCGSAHTGSGYPCAAHRRALPAMGLRRGRGAACSARTVRCGGCRAPPWLCPGSALRTCSV